MFPQTCLLYIYGWNWVINKPWLSKRRDWFKVRQHRWDKFKDDIQQGRDRPLFYCTWIKISLSRRLQQNLKHKKNIKQDLKISTDFDETASFWAKGLVLVHCSLAGVWMASLILCQRIQGPVGTWDVCGAPPTPFSNSFFGMMQM